MSSDVCSRRDNCSGLLGRTSLRLIDLGEVSNSKIYCSGLLGRTSLRRDIGEVGGVLVVALFRPSRPDFIETGVLPGGGGLPA